MGYRRLCAIRRNMGWCCFLLVSFFYAAHAVKIWRGRGHDKKIGMEGQRRRQAIICDEMRNEELTRVEGGGIDCRTVGACWLCGVHDKRSKPATVAAATTTAATCREIVGLAKFRGWTRCRKTSSTRRWLASKGAWKGVAGRPDG